MESNDYVTDEGKRKQNPSAATEFLGKGLKTRKMPDRRQSSEDKLATTALATSTTNNFQYHGNDIGTEARCQINESIEIIGRYRRRNNVVV
ncbi:hypothetical protein QE152_g34497 [Popillia japonica]|uniref:Uncharacterized protein n=1 Tax=Popillia japonica TaxID=7064 RepID=A0AAW1ITR0_POPJA